MSKCNKFFVIFLVLFANSKLFLVFADVTGGQKKFDDVTACVFADVTAVVDEIFFDDVTANLMNVLPE